ncbi:serine-rich adhesin for platelets-like [Uloborus diversus]|uniref:serine-rich adhesin for platelets-like n=1 Tax=Uloborus diversus TaxID=327109 RepID=UPI002408F910|nr:serine-rich adhesin for platelets-like [Uloborus diversus]
MEKNINASNNDRIEKNKTNVIAALENTSTSAAIREDKENNVQGALLRDETSTSDSEDLENNSTMEYSIQETSTQSTKSLSHSQNTDIMMFRNSEKSENTSVASSAISENKENNAQDTLQKGETSTAEPEDLVNNSTMVHSTHEASARSKGSVPYRQNSNIILFQNSDESKNTTVPAAFNTEDEERTVLNTSPQHITTDITSTSKPLKSTDLIKNSIFGNCTHEASNHCENSVPQKQSGNTIAATEVHFQFSHNRVGENLYVSNDKNDFANKDAEHETKLKNPLWQKFDFSEEFEKDDEKNLAAKTTEPSTNLQIAAETTEVDHKDTIQILSTKQNSNDEKPPSRSEDDSEVKLRPLQTSKLTDGTDKKFCSENALSEEYPSRENIFQCSEQQNILPFEIDQENVQNTTPEASVSLGTHDLNEETILFPKQLPVAVAETEYRDTDSSEKYISVPHAIVPKLQNDDDIAQKDTKKMSSLRSQLETVRDVQASDCSSSSTDGAASKEHLTLGGSQNFETEGTSNSRDELVNRNFTPEISSDNLKSLRESYKKSNREKLERKNWKVKCRDYVKKHRETFRGDLLSETREKCSPILEEGETCLEAFNRRRDEKFFPSTSKEETISPTLVREGSTTDCFEVTNENFVNKSTEYVTSKKQENNSDDATAFRSLSEDQNCSENSNFNKQEENEFRDIAVADGASASGVNEHGRAFSCFKEGTANEMRKVADENGSDEDQVLFEYVLIDLTRDETSDEDTEKDILSENTTSESSKGTRCSNPVQSSDFEVAEEVSCNFDDCCIVLEQKSSRASGSDSFQRLKEKLAADVISRTSNKPNEPRAEDATSTSLEYHDEICISNDAKNQTVAEKGLDACDAALAQQVPSSSVRVPSESDEQEVFPIEENSDVRARVNFSLEKVSSNSKSRETQKSQNKMENASEGACVSKRKILKRTSGLNKEISEFPVKYVSSSSDESHKTQLDINVKKGNESRCFSKNKDEIEIIKLGDEAETADKKELSEKESSVKLLASENNTNEMENDDQGRTMDSSIQETSVPEWENRRVTRSMHKMRNCKVVLNDIGLDENEHLKLTSSGEDEKNHPKSFSMEKYYANVHLSSPASHPNEKNHPKSSNMEKKYGNVHSISPARHQSEKNHHHQKEKEICNKLKVTNSIHQNDEKHSAEKESASDGSKLLTDSPQNSGMNVLLRQVSKALSRHVDIVAP